MDLMSGASETALIAGAFLLVVASIATLLRRTRGEPPLRRFGLMMSLVYAAVKRAMPYWSTIISFAAGIGAFAASFLIGIGATILCIRIGMPNSESQTDMAAFADGMMALFHFVFGAVLSLMVASIVGMIVGSWVDSRQAQRRDASFGTVQIEVSATEYWQAILGVVEVVRLRDAGSHWVGSLTTSATNTPVNVQSNHRNFASAAMAADCTAGSASVVHASRFLT